MSLTRVAGFAVWFSLAYVAFGQQETRSQISQGPPQKPAETATVRSYLAGQRANIKVVSTRTESGGRELITESSEATGPDGRFETVTKTTTETVGAGSDSVNVTRDVLGNGPNGPLTLIERSIAEQEKLPDGTSRTITNAWTPEANGDLRLRSRQVQEVKLVAPDVLQTDAIIYVPGLNEPLRESERFQQTERQAAPDLIQIDGRREFRRPNGVWQTTETRNQEVRRISPAEVVEEETIRNLNGDQLTLQERAITRRSIVNGSQQVVTEIYSSFIPGVARDSNRPLDLDQRIRVTTTPTLNGGSETIAEREARLPGVLNGPIRVVERTVETVQQIGPDLWETQRQTFTIDGSGRLVLTMNEKQETKGK
jgi:hypothetical protein